MTSGLPLRGAHELWLDGKLVLERVAPYSSWRERARGLISRPPPPDGAAVLLVPCRGVHTWFMRYPIDVVFLDAESRIVRVVANLAPGRAASGGRRAAAVLELPSGRIDPRHWRPDARVAWTPAPSVTPAVSPTRP